jgi:hypothetical protein
VDELDNLLTPTPVPSAPELRSMIWQRTAGVQRRRRWMRFARTAAFLAACYVAGAATVWWWQAEPAPANNSKSSTDVPPPLPLPNSGPAPAPPGAVDDPYRDDPPQIIEQWAARAEGRRRVELYRRAGDLYYERLADHAAAIRCYRRALDAGTAADLVVRADKDNWLLMSLKMARLKERRDARN